MSTYVTEGAWAEMNFDNVNMQQISNPHQLHKIMQAQIYVHVSTKVASCTSIQATKVFLI